MLGAFTYLAVASARNRMRRQARRLRSPRYLIALVAGGFYMWWFLVRPAHQGGASAIAAQAWTTRLGALGFALLAAKWWLAGADERALAFSQAEIHLLFPAPVTRRMLVGGRLLRAQFVILVNTVVWSVILRGDGMHLSAWRRALGVWILFSTLHLHRLGAALTTASATKHGAAGRRRQIVPLLVFGAALGALAWSFYAARGELARAATFGMGSVIQVLGRQLEQPPASIALFPFRSLLAPALASDLAAWLRSIGVAIAILVLHAVWVLRTDAAFEEAAVEASDRRAERRSKGGREAPRPSESVSAAQQRRRTMPLPSRGSPALAIIWKNLLSAARSGVITRHLSLLAVVAVVALFFSARDERIAEVASIVAGVWSGILVIAGPLWVRFDLRMDLPQIAVLRAWPLRSRDLVTAQIAASAIALTAFQVALLAGLVVVSFLGDVLPIPADRRLAFALTALVALPGINAAALTIQNAVALLFPAWTRLGAGPRGVEAMGQSLVSMAGSFALLALLLAFPAAIAVVIAFGLRPALDAWAYLPAAATGTALVFVELVPVMAWLGRVFERTEPSAVG